MRSESRRERERGTAAVEFALVLTPLMFCIFGIIDFGMAFHAQMRLTEAARQGVRTAVLTPADQDPADKARLMANEALGFVAGDAEEPVVAICADGATQASVSITYPFDGVLFLHNKELKGQAVMQCPS
jgi:Flp pilus assembly protein TadG